MSVASRNPFEILGGEGESQSVAAPSVEKEQTTTTPATSSTRGGQRGKTGPASRGGRYYQRGGAGKSAPRDQAEGEEGAAREVKRNGEEAGRGRGRGGRARGDRGRAGAGAGGRGRPFDKHSQTGKTDSNKKIHQGWGGDEGKSELKAEVDGSKDADAEVPTTNDWAANGAVSGADDAWGVPAAAANGETTDAPAESRRPREEEEDNTLTLDQYLAKQKENVTVPKLETVRKANDGADDLFKDAVKVVKSEEDAYFAGKPKQSKQRTKAKDDKIIIEIDGQFSDRVARGGRGGRGGDRARVPRGGGRGGRGRGRGEFHGSNGNAATGAVNVADESAFPSLA